MTDRVVLKPTVSRLMIRYGLTLQDAKLVVETVPKRGTLAWLAREGIRQNIGCRCLSIDGASKDAGKRR